MNKTYLGDGIYAEVENGMLKLTGNANGNENVIYLEPEVLQSLLAYVSSPVPAEED